MPFSSSGNQKAGRGSPGGKAGKAIGGKASQETIDPLKGKSPGLRKQPPGIGFTDSIEPDVKRWYEK